MQPSGHAITTVAVLLAAMMAQAPQAQAASSGATPVGSCLGSLPAYDVNLRKRPLAIGNEGTTDAFVSCAAQLGYNASSVTNAGVAVTNWTAQTVELTCTLVDGVLHPVFASYYPKTVSVGPYTSAVVGWLPSDSGSTYTGFENFSCKLPPGVEINFVGFDYL